MNMDSLIEDLRAVTALPGRGTPQLDRYRRIIRICTRQFWADMPDAFLREEYRFKLEPPVSVSTISIDSTDRLVFTLDVAPTVPAQLALDGTLRGRWLEVLRNGEYYYRRVRDVYVETVIDDPDLLHIVIDRPWDNNTDTTLTYRIFTYQYPYPADVQKILSVHYDPDVSPSQKVEPKLKAELDIQRWAQGWREQGRITSYARGDFYQLPAPHEKPGVALLSQQPNNNQKWGWDPVTGVEHTLNVAPAYGNAGSFEYRYSLAWGRYPWGHLSVGDRGDELTGPAQGPLDPFYISAPSQATDAQAAVWGGSAIQVTALDVDYQYGYGPDTSRRSYHHYGCEKWWWRRRLSSEPVGGTNNAGFQEDPDAVWYLWKITPGHQTSVVDHGDLDPVDKRTRLEHIHGHQHLMFDKLPPAGEEAVMLAMVQKRPPEPAHDQDYIRIPPECESVFLNLCSAYVLGRREGEPNKESQYWGAYQRSLEDLRRRFGNPGHAKGPFGSGLGAGVPLHYIENITDGT